MFGDSCCCLIQTQAPFSNMFSFVSLLFYLAQSACLNEQMSWVISFLNSDSLAWAGFGRTKDATADHAVVPLGGPMCEPVMNPGGPTGHQSSLSVNFRPLSMPGHGGSPAGDLLSGGFLGPLDMRRARIEMDLPQKVPNESRSGDQDIRVTPFQLLGGLPGGPGQFFRNRAGPWSAPLPVGPPSWTARRT